MSTKKPTARERSDAYWAGKETEARRMGAGDLVRAMIEHAAMGGGGASMVNLYRRELNRRLPPDPADEAEYRLGDGTKP